MALDGKLLNIAAERLKENKARREAEIQSRRRDIYREIPRLREIDRQLRVTISDTIARALRKGGDPEAELAGIQAENLELQAERAELLVAAGYPMDHIDDTPNCAVCGDSGYRGGKICSCLTALYGEAQREELSSLLKLGEETFDSFRLDYYDAETDPVIGTSPRQNMELNYEVCLQYARRFGKASGNLFLTGAAGLGKTFLSACIAKVVSEGGFSVVYDTAVNVFGRFEEEKFSRSAENAEAAHDIRRYLNCDLLILDDLGTEFTTNFVVSSLYTLLSHRLAAGEKTIINSNCGLEELRKKYSDAIVSRLTGEYDVLTFYGTDIRLIKKGLA